MKKIIFMSLIICLVSFGGAYARDDKEAFVFLPNCSIPADDPDNFCGVEIEGHGIGVITSGGMIQFFCHGKLPEGCEPPPGMRTLRGVVGCYVYTDQCGVVPIWTYNSLAVLSAGGTITVFCQFDKNQECTP
jgi:hypothetical protein